MISNAEVYLKGFSSHTMICESEWIRWRRENTPDDYGPGKRPWCDPVMRGGSIKETLVVRNYTKPMKVDDTWMVAVAFSNAGCPKYGNTHSHIKLFPFGDETTSKDFGDSLDKAIRLDAEGVPSDVDAESSSVNEWLMGAA